MESFKISVESLVRQFLGSRSKDPSVEAKLVDSQTGDDQAFDVAEAKDSSVAGAHPAAFDEPKEDKSKDPEGKAKETDGSGSAKEIHFTVDPITKIVVLPEGTSISAVQVKGKDLVLTQPDGSVVIIDAAVYEIAGVLFVPTIIIGNVALSPSAVANALGLQPSQVAAEPQDGSGGNNSAPPGDIGPVLDLTALLPPTAFGFIPPVFDEVEEPLRQPDEPAIAPLIVDNPVEITDLTPEAEGGELSLFEANLADGTSPDGSQLTKSESFTISAPDGLATLQIGSTVFTAAELAATNTTPVTIVGTSYGDLTITGYNQTTGVVTYTYTLKDNTLDHGFVDNGENSIFDNVPVTATDIDGDSASSVISIQIVDDAPVIDLISEEEAQIIIDESLGENADEDEVGSLGSITIPASILFLSNVTPGADGLGSSTYALELTTPDASTGLYTLDSADISNLDGDGIGQGVEIVLNQSGNVVTGTANGITYFTIEVDPNTGDVTFTQFENIWHSDPSNNDELETMNTLPNVLNIVQTVVDGDGDSANDLIDIGQGIFAIEDDGPSADLSDEAELDMIVLDESPVPPNGDGIVSATANFADNFVGPTDFGTDGPGSVTYSLNLVGSNVGSGLYALDNTDTSDMDGDGIGQGAEILLNQAGNTITGSAGGTDYFTISIDPATGIVTFTQLNNIWHSDTADHDDSEALTTSSASLLQVVQTVVDADGDSATAAVDLGGGNVFKIEDDGPSATADGQATLDMIVLDESPVPPNGDGIVSATANFADNFVAPTDFGTDGPGSVTYSLNLVGSNVGSGLYALDNTDTSDMDGDGIGQGNEIVLNQVGNVITGSAGGTDYFTIEVNPATGVVTFTQLNNIWHSDTADHDDSEALTTSSASLLQVVQTVVDADGDSATAAIDLGSGNVFKIEDDGPSATVDGQATLDMIVLDESPVPPNGDGIVSATANFADNFVAPTDFGTDGPGSVTYSLNLVGSNVGSGLYALDNTDTSDMDGDGIGQGNEIVLNQVGNVITGSAGGTDYFTIEINPTTGVITFTQLNNIWHSDTADHDDSEALTTSSASLLQVVQTVVDADGDSATAAVDLGGGNVFKIEDDGPSATADGQATLDMIVLDESPVPPNGDGIVSATANFADNFVGPTDFGTDGPGSVTYSLNLVGSNVGSGLYALDNTDTSDMDGDGIGQGNEIVLNQVGNVITGSAGGTDYFTIEINPTTGVITFTQLNNIWHSDTADHDDSEALTTSSASLLQVVQTVVDADGDSATAAVDLGGGNVFKIEDDGPSATADGQATLDMIVLDESPVPPNGDGIVSATANFADNFVGPTDFGTDGPGSVTYSLNLVGSNVGSGLYALDNTDTSDMDGDGIGQGAEILLNQAGNTITGSAGGTDYFTISIDPATGIVTFTQLNNIWHSDTADHDDSEALTTSSASLLQVVQTVVDADGDSATAAVDLGGGNVFKIEDDGPSATADGQATLDMIVLDESPVPPNGDGIVSATANFADNFVAPTDFGTDGPGSVTYSLNLVGSNVGSGLYALDNTDTSDMDGDGIGQGNEIVLNQVGNVITGSAGGTDYFTIEINPTTGVITFTQLNNIWHSDTADHDDSETLTTSSANLLQIIQTVVDADGDSASAAVDLGQNVFKIEDDGPSASIDGSGPPFMIVLDESPVPPNGDGIVSASANLSGGSVSIGFGTDGPGSGTFSLNLTGSNVGSGLYALDPTDTSDMDGDGIGQGDEIVLNQSGNVVTGSAGGTDYFTIEVNPTTGEVTFTQLNNIWHSDTADHDDSETLNTSTADLLQLVLTVVDADGDSASGSVDLGQGVFKIEDDGPSATVDGQATLDMIVLDESPVPPNGDGIVSATANFADNFVAPTDFGTDGPGAVTYSLNLTGSNVGSGLYALDPTDTDNGGDGDGFGQGDEIVLNQVGNVITGSAGGTDYFTIEINPTTGVITFTQLNNIWHSDTADHDDSEALTTSSASLLQVVQTVVDADGDSATAAIDLGGGNVFKIEDDGPSATVDGQATLDMIVLDESPVPPNGDGIVSATANFADNFVSPTDFGTDGAGGVIYGFLLSGPNVGSGLYALDPTDTSDMDGDGIGQGDEIVLNQSGNVITGSAGGTDYFTIEIDPSTGIVTFTQLNNIWHSDTADHDDSQTLTTASANQLRIIQIVFDADADSTSATLDVGQGVFKIEDDGPSATVDGQATLDMIVLDESPVPPNGDGIVSATANFADNFVAPTDFGTDGPGAATYSLNLVGSNVGSGLFALDPTDKDDSGDGDGYGQGDEIVLNQVGNVITGSAGGTDYFTIEVNPATGVVTFTQLNNIWHGDPTNPDDSEALTTSSANLLQIIQTVVDADGDSATAAVDLGQNVFKIEDDGPSAAVDGQATLDMIVLDESPVPPNGDGIVSATANFADNFVAPTDFGTDGPGLVAYFLVLTGNNVGSGLYALDNTDTSDMDGDGFGQGAEILLNQTGNTITGSAGGTDYFTISIDPATGIVTFTQLNNIWHSDTADHDDSEALTTATADLLKVEQAVVDADSDIATASINLGGGNVFKIEDDGPSATVDGQATLDMIVLDESPVPPDGDGIVSATANFADNFVAPTDFGTDGPGLVAYFLILTGNNVGSGLYALDPTDTSDMDGDGIGQGAEILLNQAGNTITGSAGGTDYFTIEIDPNTGIVTFTQLNNIWHSDTGDHDDSEALTTATADLLKVEQAIIDADGDTTTASINLGGGDVFKIEDDGPSTSSSNAITLDEDGLPGGNLGGPGDFNPMINGPIMSSGTLSHDFGTDGAGAIDFASMDGAMQSQLGITVTFSWNAGTNTLTANDGTKDVFKVEVTNPATGAFTVTLLAALNHHEPAQADNLETDWTFDLTYTVQDADGDTTTGTLQVIIDDDTPIEVLPESIYLINQDNTAESGKLDIDENIDDNVGADQLGSIRFDPALDGTDSGLTSNTQTIYYHLSSDGQTLVASTLDTYDADTFDPLNPNPETVFIVVLDTDGSLATANDTYIVEMFGTVDGGASTIDFSSGNFDFVGGNDPWAGFVPSGQGPSDTPVDDDSQDLLLTPIVNGMDGGTINSSAISGGVGSGNSVGMDEGVRIDFVVDLTGDPQKDANPGDYSTGANRDHVFDGHYVTNGASAVFTATSGSQVGIIAFDDPDGNNVVGDGTPDTITGLLIEYAGDKKFIDLTTTMLPSVIMIGGINFTIDSYVDGDGNTRITVDGVQGDGGANPTNTTTIAVFTADGFNSVEFYWEGGNEFKIGDFGAVVIDPGDPIDISLGLELEDADGDTISSSLDFTLMPSDNITTSFATSGVPVNETVTGDVLHLIGSDFNDTLTGNDEDNILYGNRGDDTLIGNGGNDRLDGGLGEDTMTGGAGEDTFVISADMIQMGLEDVITDYSGVGGDEDLIDLTELLDVALGTDLEASGHVAIMNDGVNTQVEVDVDGAAGDAYTAETVVVLQNVVTPNETIRILYDDGQGNTGTDVA